MQILEKEFDRDLYKLYLRVKEVYNPKVFYKMYGELGALKCAQKLLEESRIHSGFTRLVEERKLELTVEAFVMENTKYHPLFSEKMLDNARRKLNELEYPG